MKKNNDAYAEGYQDGVRASLEDTGIHAYFAGVGYGKKSAADRHIGFESHKHLEEFEKGVRQKDKHFIAVKKEMGFFERLFDFKSRRRRRKLKSSERNRRIVAKGAERRQRTHQKQARSRVRRSGWKKQQRRKRK